MSEEQIIDMKPQSPSGGVLELKILEVEAIRSIVQAEQEIQRAHEQLVQRRARVMTEITSAHKCPPNATINVSNLETGAATWTLPEKTPTA